MVIFMDKYFINLVFVLIYLSTVKLTQAEEAMPNVVFPVQQVKLAAKPDFILNAHYFKAQKSKGGALIFHECSNDIAPFISLAESLQKLRIDALVLDMRGFGQSVSEIYSHEAIKKKSKDIVTYQQNAALLNAYWGDDALLAYNYLREKLEKKQPISVVSSGCSAFTAVQLAENVHLKTAVYLAPEMDFMAKERYKNLVDIPTYFFGSVHHVESFQTAKELFNWNGDNRTKVQLAKGTLRSNNFLKPNSGLIADIAQWIARNTY